MTTTSVEKKVDDLTLLAQRFDQIVKHKYRDKTSIADAMEVQDKLRKKTRGEWVGSNEIKKWRTKR